MTDNNNTASSDDTNVNTEVDSQNDDKSLESGTGDDAESRISALEDQINKLTAEATTQRKLKQRAIKERDELKGNQNNDDEKSNYRSLYENERIKNEAMVEQAKQASIDAAVSQQLTKVGVLPDAVGAATKLLDRDLIEWDMQAGLDQSSVEAAIAKLKYDHKFLFEGRVTSTKPRTPADTTSSKSSKEMTRSDFNELSPQEQASRVKNGYKIIDD